MRALLLIVTLVLAGCVGPPLVLAPVEQSELDQFKGPKSAYVTGQAFLRQQGGGVVTCAGAEVFILPDTKQVRSIFDQLKVGARVSEGQKPDPRIKALSMQTRCDAEGRFALGPVVPGPYFVSTEVTWAVGYAAQGGYLRRSIWLSSGQRAEVLLTAADLFSR